MKYSLYFYHDRPEIRQLIPANAVKILDVGCGAGVMGEMLKISNKEVTGIENNNKAAKIAEKKLD